MIKSMCNYSGRDKICDIERFKARAITRGFTSDDIETTIKNYCILDVIVVDDVSIRLIK